MQGASGRHEQSARHPALRCRWIEVVLDNRESPVEFWSRDQTLNDDARSSCEHHPVAPRLCSPLDDGRRGASAAQDDFAQMMRVDLSRISSEKPRCPAGPRKVNERSSVPNARFLDLEKISKFWL